VRTYLSETDWDLAEKMARMAGYRLGVPPPATWWSRMTTPELGEKSLKVYVTT
jgi:hypothetical protein